MKKTIIAFSGFLAMISLSSCIGLYSISSSEFSQSSGNTVSGSAQALGILALSIPSVEELERKALSEAKAGGAVNNITTRLSMRNWILVQNYKVVVIGEK